MTKGVACTIWAAKGAREARRAEVENFMLVKKVSRGRGRGGETCGARELGERPLDRLLHAPLRDSRYVNRDPTYLVVVSAEAWRVGCVGAFAGGGDTRRALSPSGDLQLRRGITLMLLRG